jgi:NAD(P) transhydrogenase subunit alpha
MMMTPAGTIPPAKVFVIGAGVAGLQAIATAKRLGARVEAFDTRPVVEEQVLSLGAKFVKVDLGETGQNKDGYANALTEEQLKIQQQAMAKSCANADLVITTAKLFARKAPVIVTKEILKQMRDGSVVIDLAAGSGGNVEGTVADDTVVIEGVHVIGLDNLPGEVAFDASAMYSSNLTNLITHFYNKDTRTIDLDPSDEIMNGCLVVKNGQIVNERLKELYGG